MAVVVYITSVYTKRYMEGPLCTCISLSSNVVFPLSSNVVFPLSSNVVFPLSSNVVYLNDAPIQMGGISKMNPKLKHHLVWKYSVELYIAAKILYKYVHVLLLLGIISRYEIMTLDSSCLGKL